LLEIIIENRFKKDIERDKKSGRYSKKDFELLKEIINKLANNGAIDEKYKRHLLKGDLKRYECIHVKGDWLLVFKITSRELYLVMLGKHSQVYKKYK
jgi:mRNA interferase YafQ